MNWIVEVVILFVFSVITYVLVRKSSLLGVPTQLTNFAMNFIPAILFIVIAIAQKESMTINLWQWLVILFTAIFCSYLGNICSLKSIERAPNPGFSLIISKSYVVFTTLVAIGLFGAEFSWFKMGAIGLIVISSAVIMLGGSSAKNSQSHSSWILLSLGAFFCWGMLALLSKYLLDQGVGVMPRLVYVMSIVSLIIGFDLKRHPINLKVISKNAWLALLGIGVSGGIFNYMMQSAYRTAPNIGYVNAVNAASIAGVTVISGLFFKDELTVRKMAGVVGVIIGLWWLLK